MMADIGAKKSPFVVLGLPESSLLHAVKKAYKKLAKENHPDRFTDPVEKKIREERMADINAAYRDILSGLNRISDETVRPSDREKESDYSLYKMGLDAFNRYGTSLRNGKYIDYDLETMMKKKRLFVRRMHISGNSWLNIRKATGRTTQRKSSPN